MRILFYQDPPNVKSTMLTWTLGEELILLGHEVYFDKPPDASVPHGYFDWVRVGSVDSPAGVAFARSIGAKVHVHLEGVGYWRVGADSALRWGYDKPLNNNEINRWKDKYRSWMKAAYDADSCSVNGKNQIHMIENLLFDGKKLPNCHRLSCGADARFALSLPDYFKENYFVTVSRLEENKKVHMIAGALKIASKTVKIPQWVILGNGTHEQMKKINDIMNDTNIRVTLFPCFGARKWMYIKKASLMLCGWMGIPPAEGLLCNTPVLSFNHPDIIEMYEDSIWWAKDNDVQDYADKIIQLIEIQKNTPYVTESDSELSKIRLLEGELYACTQEQLALKYDKIFKGELEPWER